MSNFEEREQFEQVRAFWADYGRLIVLVCVLVIVAVVGVYSYSQYQTKKQQGSSVVYDHVSKAIEKTDFDALGKALKDGRDDFGASDFVLVSHLMAAQFYFGKEKLDDAAQTLIWVKDSTKDDLTRVMATLRLASVYVDQKKLDEALQLLDDKNLMIGTLNELVNEQKGDVLFLKGMKAEAKEAYGAAADNYPSPDQVPMLLQMKMNMVK
jgi:predicted negative regulator of RcsB-dependent stress response